MRVSVATALQTAARDELLDPAAVDRLAGVQVALRVTRDRVQEGELSRLPARLPELVEDRADDAVHLQHLLVAAVGLVHDRLPRIVREVEIPRRAGRVERRLAVRT